jgi:AcrR family transcriptional regulator
MNNKRQLSKETTKKLILEKTKELIVENGILNTSTKRIAEYCKVAHGTLFAHFNNREQLISEVLKNELLQISKRLYRLKPSNNSLEHLLYKYFELVIDEEELFVVINKEFPFINHNIKREIITTETIVKILILKKIKQGVDNKLFKSIDPTIAMSFLFGTLNYYLSRKEFFIDAGSIIQKKKKEIIDTFLIYIGI